MMILSKLKYFPNVTASRQAPTAVPPDEYRILLTAPVIRLSAKIIAGHKVRALNKRISEEIKISGSLNGAKRGEWVEVKLLHNEYARANVPAQRHNC